MTLLAVYTHVDTSPFYVVKRCIMSHHINVINMSITFEQKLSFSENCAKQQLKRPALNVRAPLGVYIHIHVEYVTFFFVMILV